MVDVMHEENTLAEILFTLADMLGHVLHTLGSNLVHPLFKVISTLLLIIPFSLQLIQSVQGELQQNLYQRMKKNNLN